MYRDSFESGRVIELERQVAELRQQLTPAGWWPLHMLLAALAGGAVVGMVAAGLQNMTLSSRRNPSVRGGIALIVAHGSGGSIEN